MRTRVGLLVVRVVLAGRAGCDVDSRGFGGQSESRRRMRRVICLALMDLALLSALVVTTGWAQVHRARLDEERLAPETAAPVEPSLVLAEGGLRFPDGSVQSSAATTSLMDPAPIPVTGQTTTYGTGDDGDLQRGAVWPNPRFTDSSNGTVTDNLTGLIWLKDANCANGTMGLNAALVFANTLFDGSTDHNGGDCSLSDTSGVGAWRLPNALELYSLVHLGVDSPALPNTSGTGKWAEGDPFTGVQWGVTVTILNPYWTSTWLNGAYWALDFWFARFDVGGTFDALVWPVRSRRRDEPQPETPPPPSLVLAEGSLQFPDGSVQNVAVPAEPGAPVRRTGSFVGSPGGDGYLRLGVEWPNPRFTDNGDGTVKDELTGLIWLQDADCFGSQTWSNALAKSNALFDGCTDCGGTDNDCGLSDGSVEGQWRLPNLRELLGLVHFGQISPAVPNTSGRGKWVEGDPFSGLASGWYWSSTTLSIQPTGAWGVEFSDHGYIFNQSHSSELYVWPVRGGQYPASDSEP